MAAFDQPIASALPIDATGESLTIILEGIAEAVVILDAAWRCIYLNAHAELAVRQTRHEMLGASVWDRLPELHGTVFEQGMRDAASTGQPTYHEGYYAPFDSWFEMRAYPSAAGLIVVFGEVTARKATEARLRFQAQLLDQVDVAVIATDMGGLVTHWNAHATRIYGWTREEALQRPIRDLTVGPSDAATVVAIWSRLRAGESWSGDFIARRKDGTTFPAQVHDSPIRDDEENLIGIIGVSTDRTAYNEAEARTRAVETRYRALVEQIPAVVYVNPIGDSRVERYVSPRILELTGYSSAEWLAAREGDMSPRFRDDRARVATAEAHSAATGAPFAAEYRLVRKDGELIWVRDEAVVVLDDDGTPNYWQGYIVDVTKRHRTESQLQHQATHDALTGLPNRALLLDRLAQRLLRERGGERCCAVCFLDLDRFKEINDTHGHDTGDQLLQAVGKRLRRMLRDEDMLARLGGDEFVVLLNQVAEGGEAAAIAERLLAALAEPFRLHWHEFQITASIGIVMATAEHQRAEDLLRDADIALYRAKDSGRGCYILFDPEMQRAFADRLALERDLWLALDRGEFVLHYQPLIDLRTGEIVEVEALIRWQHPQRVWLMPADFIPLAEECGAIRPLGRWIVNEACRQARVWLDTGAALRPLIVAVNLSAQEFADVGLADMVVETLHTAQLPAHLLRLKITETAAMGDAAATLNVLHILRAIGVRLALDDFGTGYSSLNYLRQFPVDTLKIDRAFIRDLTVDRRNVERFRWVVG
jgi:diguanylate cyclase (GGDEF)-like protein/PAS domain S-box-containing protein